MIHDHFHNTAAPVIAATTSCVLGFNLHEVLGYAGQIVGLLSGVISIVWVGYQIRAAARRKH
jgi:hypothetical protein